MYEVYGVEEINIRNDIILPISGKMEFFFLVTLSNLEISSTSLTAPLPPPFSCDRVPRNCGNFVSCASDVMK